MAKYVWSMQDIAGLMKNPAFLELNLGLAEELKQIEADQEEQLKEIEESQKRLDEIHQDLVRMNQEFYERYGYHYDKRYATE